MPTNHYIPSYFAHRDQLDLHTAHSLLLFASLHHLTKVLDVGCGTGLLVKFFKSHGLTATGCDKYYAARGIVNCSATKLPYRANSLDLITSISVIEHLTPHEANLFLCEAFRVLRPGGFIFIVTPNYSSPNRLLRGSNWFAYSDPTHLTYYTPNSLAKLALFHGFVSPNFTFAYSPKYPLINPLVSYLFISSFLAKWRDSFWLSAQKS